MCEVKRDTHLCGETTCIFKCHLHQLPEVLGSLQSQNDECADNKCNTEAEYTQKYVNYTLTIFFNLTVTLQAPTYKLNLETLMSHKNNQSQNRLTKKKKKKVGKILTGGLSSRYNSWG